MEKLEICRFQAKYLYNNGNQYVELTGGFTVDYNTNSDNNDIFNANKNGAIYILASNTNIFF